MQKSAERTERGKQKSVFPGGVKRRAGRKCTHGQAHGRAGAGGFGRGPY